MQNKESLMNGKVLLWSIFRDPTGNVQRSILNYRRDYSEPISVIPAFSDDGGVYVFAPQQATMDLIAHLSEDEETNTSLLLVQPVYNLPDPDQMEADWIESRR